MFTRNILKNIMSFMVILLFIYSTNNLKSIQMPESFRRTQFGLNDSDDAYLTSYIRSVITGVDVSSSEDGSDTSFTEYSDLIEKSYPRQFSKDEYDLLLPYNIEVNLKRYVEGNYLFDLKVSLTDKFVLPSGNMSASLTPHFLYDGSGNLVFENGSPIILYIDNIDRILSLGKDDISGDASDNTGGGVRATPGKSVPNEYWAWPKDLSNVLALRSTHYTRGCVLVCVNRDNFRSQVTLQNCNAPNFSIATSCKLPLDEISFASVASSVPIIKDGGYAVYSIDPTLDFQSYGMFLKRPFQDINLKTFNVSKLNFDSINNMLKIKYSGGEFDKYIVVQAIENDSSTNKPKTYCASRKIISRDSEYNIDVRNWGISDLSGLTFKIWMELPTSKSDVDSTLVSSLSYATNPQTFYALSNSNIIEEDPINIPDNVARNNKFFSLKDDFSCSWGVIERLSDGPPENNPVMGDNPTNQKILFGPYEFWIAGKDIEDNERNILTLYQANTHEYKLANEKKEISNNLIPKQLNIDMVSVEDTVYDGQEKTPEVTVKDGLFFLRQGQDYEVSYANNINAGDGIVIVKGIGKYRGEINTNFKIFKAKLDPDDIPLAVENLTYNKKSQDLVSPPKKNKTTYYRLADNDEWFKEIPSAKNAKEYKIYWYIDGGDNYESIGSESEPAGVISTTINAKLLSPNDVVMYQDIIVTDGNKFLADGIDYYVSEKYIDHNGNVTSENSDDVNTLETVVKGIGNYTGTVKNIRQIVTPDDNGYIDNIDNSGWGNDSNAYNSGITHYIEPNGKTSVEVWGNGIIWLKEESDGTYAWYGLDNTSGFFKKGSKFWVRWLDSDVDPDEWSYYYDKLDYKHRVLAEEGKLWIFLTGVTLPDGTEYGDFGGTNIPYYIQLGSDWDREDINAVFVNTSSDEIIGVGFVDNFEFPEGLGSFAKLMLKHFSPYAIYDEGYDINLNYIQDYGRDYNYEYDQNRDRYDNVSNTIDDTKSNYYVQTNNSTKKSHLIKTLDNANFIIPLINIYFAIYCSFLFYKKSED